MSAMFRMNSVEYSFMCKPHEMGCFQRADYTLFPKLPNTKGTKDTKGIKDRRKSELAPVKWTQIMSRSSTLGKIGKGSWTNIKENTGRTQKNSN
jgi:hypothetical protein